MTEQERNAAIIALAKLAYNRQERREDAWQELDQYTRDVAVKTVLQELCVLCEENGYLDAELIASNLLHIDGNVAGEVFDVCYQASQAMNEIL